MKAQRTAEFNREALEHLDALFGYAMTLTREPTLAEDLVQETYLRAVRAANQLAADSNLKTWLFVIMRNAWLNQVRHEHSGPKFVELESDVTSSVVGESDTNPHVIYLRKLARVQIEEAVDSLPEASREVVVLRDFEGFSYQEIATVLGCPAGTVMSRLGRARGKLREMLSGWQSKKRARTV